MAAKTKYLIAVFICLGFNPMLFAQETKPTSTDAVAPPKEKIRQYWYVLLKTGPNTKLDSAQRAELFAGHMSNMKRLHEDGILKAAGPFGKNDFTWRGLFIFDCKTREEAEKIASTDPAVAAGLFSVDIVPWYTEPSGNFLPGKPEKHD